MGVIWAVTPCWESTFALLCLDSQNIIFRNWEKTDCVCVCGRSSVLSSEWLETMTLLTHFLPPHRNRVTVVLKPLFCIFLMTLGGEAAGKLAQWGWVGQAMIHLSEEKQNPKLYGCFGYTQIPFLVSFPMKQQLQQLSWPTNHLFPWLSSHLPPVSFYPSPTMFSRRIEEKASSNSVQ